METVIQEVQPTLCLTHICAFVGGVVLLSLTFLLLLLQLLNTLLKHVGPKVTFKVRQLLGARQSIFCRLLEDVLCEGGR